MEPMSIGKTVLIIHISNTANATPAVLSVNVSKIISDQLPRIAIFSAGIDGKIATTI